MIEVVSEVVTKAGTGGRFELVFGPGGAWSKLFSDSPGFRGTTVLRDRDNPRRYLTVDLWDSEDAHEQALADEAHAYLALETELREWVELKHELGTFRVLNRATVRPRPASRRYGRTR